MSQGVYGIGAIDCKLGRDIWHIRRVVSSAGEVEREREQDNESYTFTSQVCCGMPIAESLEHIANARCISPMLWPQNWPLEQPCPDRDVSLVNWLHQLRYVGGGGGGVRLTASEGGGLTASGKGGGSGGDFFPACTLLMALAWLWSGLHVRW